MAPAEHFLAFVEPQFVKQTARGVVLRSITRNHHLAVFKVVNHINELVGHGVTHALPLMVAVDGQAVDDPLRGILSMDQHDKARQLLLQVDTVGRDRWMTRLQIRDERIAGETALLRLDAHGGQRHELAQ